VGISSVYSFQSLEIAPPFLSKHWKKAGRIFQTLETLPVFSPQRRPAILAAVLGLETGTPRASF
jgi:hypothetical protein